MSPGRAVQSRPRRRRRQGLEAVGRRVRHRHGRRAARALPAPARGPRQADRLQPPAPRRARHRAGQDQERAEQAVPSQGWRPDGDPHRGHHHRRRARPDLHVLPAALAAGPAAARDRGAVQRQGLGLQPQAPAHPPDLRDPRPGLRPRRVRGRGPRRVGPPVAPDLSRQRQAHVEDDHGLDRARPHRARPDPRPDARRRPHARGTPVVRRGHPDSARARQPGGLATPPAGGSSTTRRSSSRRCSRSAGSSCARWRRCRARASRAGCSTGSTQALPFELTDGQREIGDQISDDLRAVLADASPAPGRSRVGQDGGRTARHAPGRRLRGTGRAARPDRGAGPAAPPLDRRDARVDGRGRHARR